jgi:hypothetical protein
MNFRREIADLREYDIVIDFALPRPSPAPLRERVRVRVLFLRLSGSDLSRSV